MYNNYMIYVYLSTYTLMHFRQLSQVIGRKNFEITILFVVRTTHKYYNTVLYILSLRFQPGYW